MGADGAKKHNIDQQDSSRTSLKLDPLGAVTEKSPTAPSPTPHLVDTSVPKSGLSGSQLTVKNNLSLLIKISPPLKEHFSEIISERSNQFLHAIKQDSSIPFSDLERMFRDGSSAQFAKMLYERDIAGNSNIHEVTRLIEKFATIGNRNDTLKLELVLEYYIRAAKNNVLDANQFIQVNPVWSGKKFPDIDTNKYLSPWKNIHGNIAHYRAMFGKKTIKILPINQNLNLSDDNKIIIIENIVFYLSCGIRSILVPMSSFNEHNNRWLFLGSNDEGIVVDGTGLIYNSVSHIDSEHNSDNLNEFIKDRVPYLEEVGKCVCFDPIKYDHRNIRDVFEVSRKIRNFLENIALVQNSETTKDDAIANQMEIPTPQKDWLRASRYTFFLPFKTFHDSSLQSINTSANHLTSQTIGKDCDFQDSWIFGLLNSNYDQDLPTQQENLSIEGLERLIQSDDFQHVMKIPRDSEAIDTQIPRETMWLQIDSHEFPDLNYYEFLELIEQAGKNKDRWLDVSHRYEKSTGRVFFNGNPYSIKELHSKAKDDCDFMAVLAFYWYREVPWRREQAIDILNKLEELGNVYASHYLGTICLFYDSYSQAKTTNHYIKAVSKIRNCPPQGHHIESIIYGNLGLTLWWWHDLFSKDEQTRLFNSYKLLCKGAALGNVYILGRLAEFLCKAIDTQKSRLIARIIIDKLVQWETFLADYYSASIEYMHNFESIRCGDEKYKEIVEKLECSIKDEKWDSFPISKQKIKLSLAFIFLRHDQGKRDYALSMLYEVDKNKAEEFSKCETRQKELDCIRDFFYIENNYLNLKMLKETLTELEEEINRLRIENDVLKKQVKTVTEQAKNIVSHEHATDTSQQEHHDLPKLLTKPPKLYTEYLAECEDRGIKPRQRKNALTYIQTTEPYRSQLAAGELFLCDLRNIDPILTRKLETLASRQKKKPGDFLPTLSDKKTQEAEAITHEEFRECWRKVQLYRKKKIYKNQ